MIPIAASTASTPFEPKKSKNDRSNPYVTTGTFQRYPSLMSIGPPISPVWRNPLVTSIQSAYGPSRANPSTRAVTNKKAINAEKNKSRKRSARSRNIELSMMKIQLNDNQFGYWAIGSITDLYF